VNSFGKAWKSGITSEIEILCDWYLTIKPSTRCKIANVFFKLSMKC
jgi:hypothetical protein